MAAELQAHKDKRKTVPKDITPLEDVKRIQTNLVDPSPPKRVKSDYDSSIAKSYKKGQTKTVLLNGRSRKTIPQLGEQPV